MSEIVPAFVFEAVVVGLAAVAFQAASRFAFALAVDRVLRPNRR